MPTLYHPDGALAFPVPQVVEAPAFELVSSLAALNAPLRFQAFQTRVAGVMGPEFLDELREASAPFRGGQSFLEFVVGEGITLGVDAFLERVTDLSVRRFVFLALGRLYPEQELPLDLHAAAVTAYIRERGMAGHIQHAGDTFAWIDTVEEHRERLVALWTRYHKGFFRAWYTETTTAREQALRRMRELIEAETAEAVYRRFSGVDRLPEQLPAGHPYESIVLAPVAHLQEATRFLYGYGKIIIPFGLHTAEVRDQVLVERRERIVQLARALSDPARIRILEVIAGNDYSFNGHRIAWRVGLSKSVVSRHLKQLSDAGLIESVSPDNRSILYRIKSETVARLSDYLRDALDPEADTPPEG